MTLQRYDPDRLDRLSLRLLDLAAMFRAMSNEARDAEIDELRLNDRKTNEWLSSLEQWAYESDGKLRALLVKKRGERRAASMEQRR
ncbi:MAG: hypothetical protein DWQ31_05070 [Planctomycetota bacterium]|nr:MAG: hypothetical protein DWQ31_05070 [Planctomycetota bacterium]REJ90070.1 MAG: hypothetical protein DWQ35_17055 [Planctomycetota bacterium]REK23150.1 MAG: hypothetical protein DWQ42_15660 [Planctomycetota bacterium]REK43425.1 MAG: hypothetical protein DWQ46_11505 [Planctomycetota bacterium]